MASEQVHQFGQIKIIAICLESEFAADDLAVLPTLLTVEAPQVKLKAARRFKPFLTGTARDDHFAARASDRIEETAQGCTVFIYQVSRGGLEVIPHYDDPLLSHSVGDQLQLVLGDAEVLSVEQLTRAIDHIFRAADVAEVEPQRSVQTARIIEPAQEAACQRCLAHSAKPLHQDGGCPTVERPFHFENRTVAADKAVRFMLVTDLLWETRRICSPVTLFRKSKVDRLLLVEHRQEPVVQRVRSAS